MKEYNINHDHIFSCVPTRENIKDVLKLLEKYKNNAVADITYKQEKSVNGDAFITIVTANRILDSYKQVVCDGMSAIIILTDAKPDEYPYIFIPSVYLSIFERFYTSKIYEGD